MYFLTKNNKKRGEKKIKGNSLLYKGYQRFFRLTTFEYTKKLIRRNYEEKNYCFYY